MTTRLSSLSWRTAVLADPRPLAVLLSLLFSAWTVYTLDAPNNDTILYLAVAERLQQGDWSGAYTLYKWPFFSGLIAALGSLTGWSLTTAGQVLDAGLAVLLVVTFISLVRELGGDRKTQWLAAFVILFHPYFNEARPLILRDYGYWACYLLGLLCFIRYQRRPDWRQALAWGGAMTLAALFRIEGVVFLVLLPIVLWWQPGVNWRERGRRFVGAYVVAAGWLPVFLIGMLVDADFASKLGRLPELSQRLQTVWGMLSSGLHGQAERLNAAILNRYVDDYALPAVCATLLLILIGEVIKTLTPLYSIMLGLRPLYAKVRWSADLVALLLWAVLLNLLAVLAYLIQQFYIVSRHVAALTLTVLPLIPFLLAALHDRWQARFQQPLRRRWPFATVALLLLYMSGDGLLNIGGPSHDHLRNAGRWLREHVPADAQLYSNHRQLNYFSGHPIDWKLNASWPLTEQLIEAQFWQGQDYLALSISRRSPQLRQRLEAVLGPPLQVFENRRQDAVLIYRVSR